MTAFPTHDFSGRTVLVTGATSGIGRMIAEGLVADGARVLICARNAARCEEAAADIARDRPGQCIGIAADLSTVAGVTALANEVARLTDRLHTLVNNAGTLSVEPLETFSEASWDSNHDLNLKAPFFLTQALLPLLRAGATAEHPASVINIGSVGGLRVGPRESYAYAAAKAGLHHLTGSLAKRLGPENITVNAIAPGFFPSEMTKITSDEMHQQLIGLVPRRRVGRPQDMAGLVRFLASPAAAYLCGVVIPLDGGMTL